MLRIRFVEIGLGEGKKWGIGRGGELFQNLTGEKECKSIGRYRFLKT